MIDLSKQAKDLVLGWWISEGRARMSKDDFLMCRFTWEEAQAYVHNTMGEHLPDKVIKGYLKQWDKSGGLTCDSVDEAYAKIAAKQKNQRVWGTPDGSEGFLDRVGSMHAKTRCRHSNEYKLYLASDAWRERRDRYLQNVKCGCLFRCEMCGTLHAGLDVHHNNYDAGLSGKEKDSDLMACCSVPCHQLADIARTIANGCPERCETAINDAARVLFQ